MQDHFKYKFDELLNPALEALHILGGSSSIDEMEDQVATLLNLTDEQINHLY